MNQISKLTARNEHFFKKSEVFSKLVKEELKNIESFINIAISDMFFEETTYKLGVGYTYFYDMPYMPLRMLIENKKYFWSDIMDFSIEYEKDERLKFNYNHGSGGENSNVDKMDCARARKNAFDIIIKLSEYITENETEFKRLTNRLYRLSELRDNASRMGSNAGSRIKAIQIEKKENKIKTVICRETNFIERVKQELNTNNNDQYYIYFVTYSRNNEKVKFKEEEISVSNFNKKVLKLNESRISKKALIEKLYTKNIVAIENNKPIRFVKDIPTLEREYTLDELYNKYKQYFLALDF